MSALQNVTVDVTVDTAALAANDVANAAVIPFPIGGHGVGKVMSLTLIDPDHNTAANLAATLWLFKASVTPAAANATHSISDGDAALCVGTLPIVAGDVALSALNSVASVRLAAPLPFTVGTNGSLYGILVMAAAPTFAGGTVRIVLGIE